MSARIARLMGGFALVLAGLTGCASSGGTDTSTTPTPSPPTAPGTSSPTPSVSSVRFLIECVALDGSDIGTFTRLEEAWASTNYVRIDHCSASVASDETVELTPEEASVAETASADLPGEDPIDLFLLTLATCVRVAPDSEPGLAGLPSSILRATQELCPEAPHAGLVDAELQTRGQQ